VELSAAIVGCGPRGLEHAAALREVDGVSLVGVCDLAESRREFAATDLGIPGYEDAGELIDATRPEIVVVATAPELRADVIVPITAHESVRAIVVEKPLALSIGEAEEIVAAADHATVQIAVGHQLRFAPHFVALQEAIEGGELGTVEFIRGLCYGDLLDQGPHLVDALRALTGGRTVLWAMSQRGTELAVPPPETGDGLVASLPAWTTHHLLLQGDVRCTLETGPLHQRSDRFGQSGDELDDYLDKRLTVVGSRGIAQFVAGGDCRILTEDDAGWRTHRGGIVGYVSATRRFHEEVRDSLLEGTLHRTEAHDALHSLEGVLACVESARRGDAVRLPLPREVGRPPLRRRSEEPEVSIILPLPDHRGYAERAVSSWTQAQSFDRDRYEVIVASDGAEERLEEKVRTLLGPGDRLFREQGAEEIELYDGAARAARGRVLVFTEPHCIAEPGFIEETLAYLARSGEVGACGRTVSVCPNALARMEQVLYDEGFRDWSQPGHWCKVILRSFVIERGAYLEAGGYETEYGRFAEFALAAKLHATGKRLGYASGAAVEHAYTTSFATLRPPIDDFLAGEMRYRLDHPADYCERYFGVPEEWAARGELSSAGARAAWGVAVRALLRPASWRSGAAPSLLSVALRLVPTALFGSRPAQAHAEMRFTLARLRCRIWRINERRLLRAYRDAFRWMTRCARLRALPRLEPDHFQSGGETSFSLAEQPEQGLFGFHRAERVNGTSFRWSKALACASIPLGSGDYRVQIDTGGLRDPRSLGVQVFFNGRRIPASRLDFDSSRITFRLTPSEFSPGDQQRLGLVAAPFRPARVTDSDDARELALPVSSVAFSRVDGEVG
jgi:predicted dehydrogenase